MIKLDFKKQSDTDNSIFYRFVLVNTKYWRFTSNESVIFWFTLHENKYIYSIGIKTDNLFPVSNATIFLDTDLDAPFYFNKAIIETPSFNYGVFDTKKCIKELDLACDIAEEIDDFFKNRFLQEYVK